MTAAAATPRGSGAGARNRWSAVAAWLALVGLTIDPRLAAAAQAASTQTKDAAAVLAGERAWGQAYVLGDGAAVERLLADEFRGVDPAGAVYDKTKAMASAAQGPHNLSDVVKDATVAVYGDVAIVQAREEVVGPPPERRPSTTVFTDTWVRRDGSWRVIAAEDLDPGAATPAALASDRSQILALRAENNKAIAAHDLAAFSGPFSDEAVFIWSDGSSAAGKAALRTRFAADFADPGFVTYVRTPQRVAVSEAGARAAEHGVWTALKRDPQGETRYGGEYSAHWVRTADGWRVRGELYVKLRCVGPRCAP